MTQHLIAPPSAPPSATGEPQAVAGVPRLFVGQIPTDKTEEDLIPLFSPFGEIEKLTLVCTPEGKSRGCAMVQFRRWSDAERAAAAINGTTTMEGGRGRALVVHFANPRRLVGSGAAEPAITPRKLFVGQIPKAATEADVAAVFAPFGEIQQINILKSKGIHAGCAFVQLASWAACEAAIDALHEQRVLPGCEHPLVVKFADAKRPDNLAAKQHRSISLLGLNGMLGPGGMLTNHAYLSGELGHMPLSPHMPLGNPLTGLPSLNGLPALFQQTAGLSLGGHVSNSAKLAGLEGSSSESLLEIDSGLPTLDSASLPLPLGALNPSVHLSPPASLHSSGSLMSLQAMQSGALGLAGMPGPPPGAYDAFAAGLMLGHGGQAPPAPRPFRLGRGVSDPAVYAHKLFIGQIPFEAGEHDLWTVFSPLGDVLELSVLRSQGRSKGCAFLTYATEGQAQAAIAAFHGRSIGNSKKLVVKFADQKG